MSDDTNTQPDGTPVVPELFDPSNATVDQVNEYLKTADADERTRVLGLEDAPEGKQRATVTREFPADETGDDGIPEGATDLGARTKGATFAEAAAASDEQPYAIPAVQTNSTDRLAAEGKSKGASFAEQAELARELYGKGNPADRSER